MFGAEFDVAVLLFINFFVSYYFFDKAPRAIDISHRVTAIFHRFFAGMFWKSVVLQHTIGSWNAWLIFVLPQHFFRPGEALAVAQSCADVATVFAAHCGNSAFCKSTTESWFWNKHMIRILRHKLPVIMRCHFLLKSTVMVAEFTGC